MLRFLAPGAVAVLLVAGCVLVTGSTDGYSGYDAGCGCEAGEVCCVVLDGGTNPTSCAASCSDPSLQLCGSSLECGDGGTCLPQTCTVEGQSVSVNTCGSLVGCKSQ